MQSELSQRLGLDHAIFAFSHCRDVVAAVSRSGGIGVLGAGWMTAEQLARELDWIDSNVGDRPYGVDVVIPQNYEGMAQTDPMSLEQELWQQIPEEHVAFARQLLADHGVPELPPERQSEPTLPGSTYATALPLVEEALHTPSVE